MPFNRLLEYFPLDRLERMTDSDRADLLDRILRKPPSDNTWRDILELFVVWPEGEARLRGLEQAARALARWDDRLRSLTTSVGALFDGAHLSSLARIVRSIEIYRRDDSGPSDLRAVVASEEAAGLTRLGIVRSEIGDAWQALLSSPHLAGLEHLHVANAVLDRDAIQGLLKSPALPRLRCLKLTDVGIRGAWLEAAPLATPVFELRRMDVSRNLLTDEGAGYLAESAWLGSVEHLTLRHNFIAEPGARALISSPFLRGMTQLDLSDNKVAAGDRAALKSLADARRVALVM